MKKLTIATLAASAALLSANSASAASFTLDSFTTPFFPLSVNNSVGFDTTGPLALGAADTDFAGLTRTINLTYVAGASVPSKIEHASDFGNDFLSFDSAASGVAIGDIVWSFAAPYDLTSIATPDLLIFGLGIYADVSAGTTPVTFEISDGINVASYTPVIAAGGPFPPFLEYSAAVGTFANAGSVDWTAITSFTLTIAPNVGGDVYVDILGFTPVPEVSTAVSAGAFAVIGGLMLLRSRKKTATV